MLTMANNNDFVEDDVSTLIRPPGPMGLPTPTKSAYPCVLQLTSSFSADGTLELTVV